MDQQLRIIFLFELQRQARFGIMASQDLQNALAAGDGYRFWYFVQALLVAVGNVSRLLWPTKGSSAERGEALRSALGVSDTSPLAARTFRNHFEHFDERLEGWAASSRARGFVDSNIGPTGMIGGVDPDDFLRNYDTTTKAVTFRGDTYILPPVTEALRQLLEGVERRLLQEMSRRGEEAV